MRKRSFGHESEKDIHVAKNGCSRWPAELDRQQLLRLGQEGAMKLMWVIFVCALMTPAIAAVPQRPNSQLL